MNLLERIRRFWLPGRGDDHPLSEEERDGPHPEQAYDEVARTVEDFVGDDFDPDARAG